MRVFVGVLAVTGSLAFAGAGQAAQLYEATLTGTVVPGSFDFDNRFGVGAGFLALDGQSFIARLIYDPTLGNVINLPVGQQGRRGGVIPFGNIGPIVDAFFTIGGVTVEFDPLQRSEIRNTGASFSWSLQDAIGAGPISDDLFFSLNLASSGHLTDTIPLSNLSGGGQIRLRSSDGFERVSANLQIATTAIRFYDAPVGVPEPASWALLIAGFGGVGAVLRRRRTAPLAA